MENKIEKLFNRVKTVKNDIFNDESIQYKLCDKSFQRTNQDYYFNYEKYKCKLCTNCHTNFSFGNPVDNKALYDLEHK